MFSFSKMWKYIWPQMRKYKWMLFSIFLLMIMRVSFGAVLSPFYFKKIIDTLSIAGENRSLLSHNLFNLVFILISVNVIATLVGRIGRFVHTAFEVNVFRDLRNFTFQKLEGNSQTFFSNIFAGSLVTKSRRFVYGWDTML